MIPRTDHSLRVGGSRSVKTAPTDTRDSRHSGESSRPAGGSTDLTLLCRHPYIAIMKTIRTIPQVAVMTFMFSPWWSDGRLSIEQLLEGIAGAGADGVEPFDRDFVADPGLVPRYRKIMENTGLCVPVVDVMTNLVYSDRRQRTEGRDALRRGLDICHELGAGIAHVAGHSLAPGIDPADGRKMIAEGLLDGLGYAQAANITLAIENFNPSPTLVCKADHCLEIMRHTDNAVKFVYDTGNFLAVREDADANFDALADHICHCHMKDYVIDAETDAGYRPCDMGDGDIPNPAIAGKLMAAGYPGWVALETRGRNDVDPVSAVERELPLLKSWFDAS